MTIVVKKEKTRKKIEGRLCKAGKNLSEMENKSSFVRGRKGN